MIQDFRFAVRRLLKMPGFTISAIAVLALGIGVNTAVFDLVNTLLFAPPPFTRPAELIQVFSVDKTNPKAGRAFSYPTYRDIQDRNDVFTDVLGFDLALVGVGPKGDTRRTFASVVSSNYFSVLGVQPAQGRAFLPEEETPGRTVQTAIVSYAYWQKHNFDPGVLGSQIFINGRPFTIVGITPRGFTGTTQLLSVEVWMPLSTYELAMNDFDRPDVRKTFGARGGEQLKIIGRLKPGMTEPAAQLRLAGLGANLEKEFPVEQKGQTFTTTPIARLSVSTAPSHETGLIRLGPLLLGMSGIVLIVACLNLANMLLAQGTARRKEIAIRLAIGGDRRRIVRQLLTEGFVLAVAGGIAGLMLGVGSSGLLMASMGRLFPFDIVWSRGGNLPVLLATLAFCGTATIVFALGPALSISRPAIASDLKQQAGEDVNRRRRRWIPGHPLVTLQIAFSLALLTAMALFVRGAVKAGSVPTGLQPGSSFLVEIDASLAGYDRRRALQLYQQLNQRLAALPGVEHAAISATVPFGMLSSSRNVQRAGIHPTTGAKPATAAEGLAFSATWNSISTDYFTVVGLPIQRGRGFTEAESTQPGGAPTAIVDDVLAKKLWPGGDALGQYIQYVGAGVPVAASNNGGIGMSDDGPGDVPPGQSIQIVGIVPAARHALFEEQPPGQIYVPFANGFQSDISYFVRFRSLSHESEPATAELIRRTIQETDPVLPVLSLRTFQQHFDSNLELWIVRASAMLFTVFGVLALGLAVVGLYGVKAYSVARRTREIGIRMALGAQRGQILRMFMREGAITLIGGVGLGLLLSVTAGKVLSELLFEVSPADPIAFVSASVLLGAAALAATWFPARRATKVNPLKALRTE